MLEKPDLPDEKIVACMQDTYGIAVVQVTFLPLGADSNTAVYRVAAQNGTVYFLKLRRGAFDETSVVLPRWLCDQGIGQIIEPLLTRPGALWGELEEYKTILYPFVEGQDGYHTALSDRQWREFGAALKRVHTANVPTDLTHRIRRETYSPIYREMLQKFLSHLDETGLDEPVAQKLLTFMRQKKAQALDLVERAERYARELHSRSRECVVCHSDLHAGNLLITCGDAFYIVDWDDPILAPKERDLMFIGGSQGFIGHTAQEEEALFYEGYGATGVDTVALAYYRYERIVVDLALYCDQLLSSPEGGADREQAFRYLVSNFLPGGTIEAAYRSDRTLR